MFNGCLDLFFFLRFTAMPLYSMISSYLNFPRQVLHEIFLDKLLFSNIHSQKRFMKVNYLITNLFKFEKKK